MSRNDDNVNIGAANVVFEIQESSVAHNPYSLEMREQDSIRTGNVEALKVCWAEQYDGKIGTLASDRLRHLKNLAVGVITLSSRSAIKGGLSPELSFSMADGFIQNIEDNITVDENVVTAMHNAQLAFADAVYQLGNGSDDYNPLIQRTKDYISRHMHDKISVLQIAAELGINADYLSALFSKTEKKTLKHYITAEKLLMCENMLKYSDYSIQDISTYFAFASQSHFTKLFKEKHGITPSEYRRKYKRE